MSEIVRKTVTQARVSELFYYDKDTGYMIRRVNVQGYWNGERAGSDNIHKTCRYLTVDGKSYKEHRLIWLYVYGCFPPSEIDHINGDGTDNRLCNLRLATHAENSQNRRVHADNVSGVLGVTYDRSRDAYQARICVQGKVKHLGRFDTVEAASEVYVVAKSRLHVFSPEVRL